MGFILIYLLVIWIFGSIVMFLDGDNIFKALFWPEITYNYAKIAYIKFKNSWKSYLREQWCEWKNERKTR